jgi:cyclopropane fatty-acyl-phospholipid synthase-like methyltransferase
VADISKFEMERSFDRIVSIEMFEVWCNFFACCGFVILQGKWLIACCAAHEKLQVTS